jgi:hypothetical protein
MEKSNPSLASKANSCAELRKKRQRIIKKSEVKVHEWTFSTENK